MVVTKDHTSTSWSLEFPGAGPSHRAIVPGRVNVIGEHVDHQSYGVLPCAIQRTAVIDALEKPIDKLTDGEPVLDIRHAHGTTPDFSGRKFMTIKDIKVSKEHHWTNYIVAAYLGLVEFFANGQDADHVGQQIDPHLGLTDEMIQKSKTNANSPLTRCYKFLVDGNVPIAAGLSSSSALTVAATLGFNPSLSPEIMTVLCANAERYMGTAGGGMDQAAAILSEEGKLGHINFHPLSIDKVPLPSELQIVIANTCRSAPKIRDAAKMYNKRVFELKVAVMELLKKADPEQAKTIDINGLLQMGLRDVIRKVMKVPEEEVLKNLTQYMEDRPYTKDDAAKALGDLREPLLHKRCGETVWTQNDLFYPFLRVRHVLTEHLRVNEFVKLCKENVKEGKPTDPAILKRLGELLDGSQNSMKGDFDCSCLEIDEVTTMAREFGALGSRLTGAGWGGCTVSLVPKEKVDSFIKNMIERYFKPLMNGTKKYETPLESLPKDEADLDSVVFATVPAGGARLNKLQYPF